MSPRHLVRGTLLLLAVSSASVLAAESAAKESPFLPPAGATAAAAPTAPTEYSLSGMTSVGKETLLSITREKDKRSTWIAVGKTSGEISVLSYDPKKDEAVIEAEGRKLTLPMRKAAAVIPANTRPGSNARVATAAALPAAPAPAEVKIPPLNQQEEKEMEARMLVSDLLEIGQQQRKAYEAAQRAAAEEKAKQARAAEGR